MRVKVHRVFVAPVMPKGHYLETDDPWVVSVDGSPFVLTSHRTFVTLHSITTRGDGTHDEWTIEQPEDRVLRTGDYVGIEVRGGVVTRFLP